MTIDKGLDHRGIWRAIYVSLWDDVEFRKFTPNEKLVFLNLRTGSLSNIPCLYHYYIETIEWQTGIRRKRILEALQTLTAANWIALQDGIVWVRKGLRFDPNIVLTNEKHLVAVKKIILSLPKLQIVRDFLDFYKIEIPYPVPSRIAYTIPYGNQDTDTDTDTEEEKDTKKEEESEEKPKVNPLSLSKGKDKIYYSDLALDDEEKRERYRKREEAKAKAHRDLPTALAIEAEAKHAG